MTRKIKQPNERPLTKLYGKNDAKKKAYRRGWSMVGQRLADERVSKSEPTRKRVEPSWVTKGEGTVSPDPFKKQRSKQETK